MRAIVYSTQEKRYLDIQIYINMIIHLELFVQANNIYNKYKLLPPEF